MLFFRSRRERPLGVDGAEFGREEEEVKERDVEIVFRRSLSS